MSKQVSIVKCLIALIVGITVTPVTFTAEIVPQYCVVMDQLVCVGLRSCRTILEVFQGVQVTLILGYLLSKHHESIIQIEAHLLCVVLSQLLHQLRVLFLLHHEECVLVGAMPFMQGWSRMVCVFVEMVSVLE